jgi:TfoX/Sxy family transcriptional regulator of competence genes
MHAPDRLHTVGGEFTMADEALASRVRAAFSGVEVTEQKMFGGICFMSGGNMLACASKRGLLVRVGKDAHASALARPHTSPMEMGGRLMAGYVFVSADGFAQDVDLRAWLALAESYVATLPPKPRKDSAGNSRRAER